MIDNQNNFASVLLSRFQAAKNYAPTRISAGVNVAVLLSAQGIAVRGASLMQAQGNTLIRQGDLNT